MEKALSNIFSVLNLDDGDDKEQIAAIAEAKNQIQNPNLILVESEVSRKPNGENSEEGAKARKDERGGKVAESLFVKEYKLPLVWIDLEMTGLNIETDRILEIACVVTDGRLTKSVEGPDLVINQPKECLDNMGEWCQDNHSASGLTKRVLESTISERAAEEQVIEFVKQHVGTCTPLLAGNSIHVDFLFLKKYMPNLAALFPHILVDVSTVMALCIRWFPRERKRTPKKEKKHRAMEDIKESIQELKFYKDNIFKGSGGKSRR